MDQIRPVHLRRAVMFSYWAFPTYVDVATSSDGTESPLAAPPFNKLHHSLLAAKRWAQFSRAIDCVLVFQLSLLNRLPTDHNGFLLAKVLSFSCSIFGALHIPSFLKVEHVSSRSVCEAEQHMESFLAHEDCDRFRAASGDLRAPFNTDRGPPDSRWALPGARQRGRRHPMRGLEKGERHPAAWSHDVRFGSDKPGRAALTQHHPRGSGAGHLFEGYLRAGAIVDVRPSPDHEGHLRCKVHERGAPGVCQAWKSGGSHRSLGEFSIDHGCQHPTPLSGKSLCATVLWL